ncbi:MAG TPA: hypothetical protein VGF86_10270 [Candidatus Tumulicola sp.]|jgi:hypothetical protein
MKWKIAAALVCAIFAAGVAARADAPSPAPSAAAVDDATQKAIAANYALGCTAAFDPSDANLDAAFANLAPTFVNIDPSGKQTPRDEVVNLAKQQMKMLKAKSCDHALESFVASDPATIVVVNTLHVAGTIQAPGGAHDFDLTDKASDTWKNAGGKWQQLQSKDLHVLVKIDGNVVEDIGS